MNLGNSSTLFNNAIIYRFCNYVDRSERTNATYRGHIHSFFNYLNNNGITAPDRDDVIRWRDKLIAQGKTANTISQYVRTLTQFFKWLDDTHQYPNIMVHINVPYVDKHARKRDALTADELAGIIYNLPRSNETEITHYIIFMLLVSLGLRTIEVSRARVCDLVTRNGVRLLMVQGKGHFDHDQAKPVPEDLYQLIKKYVTVRGARGLDPLVCSTSNRSKGKALAPSTISTIIKNILKRNGYDSDRITAHSLRHSAGTLVYQITGSLYETQNFMRHADPKTTEIYLHVDDVAQQSNITNTLYQAITKKPDNPGQPAYIK